MSNKRKLTIYYKPFDKQLEVHESTAKYRMVCAGRRGGKTQCAVGECMRQLRAATAPMRIGWIAPSFDQSKRGSDTLEMVCRDLIQARMMYITKSSPITATLGRHTITFLSADNPDSLRGRHFDFLVIDEAAIISDYAFTDVILPTLMDTDGGLLAISTPRGQRGWFYTYFQRAKKDKNIESYHWTSYDNPYIGNAVVDELRETLPDLSFRQEELAEFIDAQTLVFEKVDQCFSEIGCTCDCKPIVGVDLARKRDDTVFLSLCPRCKTIKDVDMLSQVPWTEQEIRMESFFKSQNALMLYLDGTGLGDVVQANMQLKEIKFEPIVFSAPAKLRMYTDLIATVEKGSVHWDDDKYPKIAEQLLQLEREVKKTTISYNACPGGKDDICDALSLALHGCNDNNNPQIFGLFEPDESEDELESNEAMWDEMQ
jgi:hypothetical protein